MDSKERFGSWTLAAASYNMGKTGLEKRLKQQDSDNYYDLLLNRNSEIPIQILPLRRFSRHPKITDLIMSLPTCII